MEEIDRKAEKKKSMEEIRKKVKAIITKQLILNVSEVTSNASFESLGADSLDMVELMMAFEEAFGIEIPDEDAEKIIKVKDAVKYIAKVKAGTNNFVG